jgi:hypothetical protein
VTKPSDDRSALAKGMAWAMRAMTVSLEMVVPGLLGIWLDRIFGTVAILTALGFGGGLTLAIWHLVQIGKEKPPTED